MTAAPTNVQDAQDTQDTARREMTNAARAVREAFRVFPVAVDQARAERLGERMDEGEIRDLCAAQGLDNFLVRLLLDAGEDQ